MWRIKLDIIYTRNSNYEYNLPENNNFQLQTTNTFKVERTKSSQLRSITKSFKSRIWDISATDATLHLKMSIIDDDYDKYDDDQYLIEWRLAK